MTIPTNPPLSLYVHLPWCLKKCPYCDFNSHQVPQADRREASRTQYVAALLDDIAMQAAWADERQLMSVFIGGGTPSLFTPVEIASVLAAAEQAWGFAADIEITMEVNPGALERDSFAGYRAAGVNRVSIGAQSFDAAALTRLGRLHGPEEIRSAVREADSAGFQRINLDVMHGLPGQDVATALADIDAAIALGVTHISHYQLTLEPNTAFHARPPQLPDEDILQAIGDATSQRLSSAGFERYEVSAWCQPGMQSRHNLNYWRFGDYLAIGAGAHGKFTQVGAAHRYAQPMHPQSYVDAIHAGKPPAMATIDDVAMPFEYFLNQLRLAETVDLAMFEQRTGLRAPAIKTELDAAVDRGLMRACGDARYEVTHLGQRFLNDLQALFLPA